MAQGKNKTKTVDSKNANVVTCRLAADALAALHREARARKIKPSRMAAIAIQERYIEVASPPE